MLKVKCPACKGEMELENEAAGHRVACDCGAVYELPPAPPSGDFRICVNCVRLCEKDALVCPDCSFHFLTGRFPGEGKSSSSGSEEEERGALSFFRANAPLLFKAGLLLLLVLLGVFIYCSVTASKIGVSSSAPLGRMNPDLTFNFMAFEDAEAELADAPFQDLKLYSHVENKDPGNRSSMFGDVIRLLAAPDGRIQAVLISFSIPERILAPGGTAGENFHRRLTEELGIPEKLDYESIRRGEGRFSYLEYLAEFTGGDGTFLYRHSKVEQGSGLATSKQKALFVRKDLPPEETESILLFGALPGKDALLQMDEAFPASDAETDEEDAVADEEE